jgi:hypothetical protein
MPRKDAFAEDGLTHSPMAHFLLNRCHTPTMGAMHQTTFEFDEITAHAGDEALPERYNPPDMTCR